jgi:hypothetical protein
MEKKNIYTKLMEVRVAFHKLELKKSGLNKFAGFKYYELGDFLVPATKLLQEANLCPMISFNNDLATMTLINGDEPSEQITFTSPMRDLELKGTNAVQNLGGVQTYLTRYLYIQLLNIVEADVFDATSGKDDKDNIISEAQTKRLFMLAKGKDTDKVKSIIEKHGFKQSKDITKSKYNSICEAIEKLEVVVGA